MYTVYTLCAIFEAGVSESATFTFKEKDGSSRFIRNVGTYLPTCLRRPLTEKFLFYAERTIVWFSLYLFFSPLASIFLR